MKKSKTLSIRSLFFFFSSLILTNSFGQIINVKTCDSTNRFSITHLTSIYKTEKEIGIDSVLLAESQSRFEQAPNKPVLVYDYDPYIYWFRFVFRNQDTFRRQFMLVLAPIGLKDGVLFQNENGIYKSIGKSGLKYPFETRDYPFTHNVFPFSINGSSADTFYLKVDARGVYKSFGFALFRPRDLKIFENKVYFIFGIIVGLLLLFFILNVSLYFVLKVKIHLWYALYIAFLFLIVMKNDHLDQQFLNWDSEFAYRLSPYMAIGALAIAVLMHVVQMFLKKAITKNTLMYNISMIFKINVLLSGLGHYIFFFLESDARILSAIFTWAKYSTLIGIMVIIIECIYSIRKGFKTPYFIIAGLLVFLLGAIQRLFFPSTLSFLFPPTTFHIGIILETCIISLGLVYQYYWLEKEKELELQEQIMKNISWEIHDNIGPTLTLAKMNSQNIEKASPKSANESTGVSSQLISKAIHDLRALAKSLNPDYVTDSDLINLIHEELDRVKKIGKQQMTFEQTGIPYKVPHHHSLFRVFQEVLSNAVKHSEATEIAVIITFNPNYFGFQVKDNGKGFDPDDIQGAKGLGLRNIKARMHIIGGTVDIDSSPGAGATITIRRPIQR